MLVNNQRYHIRFVSKRLEPNNGKKKKKSIKIRLGAIDHRSETPPPLGAMPLKSFFLKSSLIDEDVNESDTVRDTDAGKIK